MAGTYENVEPAEMLDCKAVGDGAMLDEGEPSDTMAKDEDPQSEHSGQPNPQLPTPRSDFLPDIMEQETPLETTASHPHRPSTSPGLSPCLSSVPTITLTATSKGKYMPINAHRLKNSLILGAGFLELANAADFAANKWNRVPVPTFAAILMAVGGTFALLTSIYAFRDAILSRENYRSLKAERVHLKSLPQSRERDVFLDVNYREQGTELIDRVCMNLFMGCGAVMVGVGTFMAIDGANPRVYRASNLLSGYIGNAPVAVFGLIDAAWSIFMHGRAQKHRDAATKTLGGEQEVLGLLKQRIQLVQSHAVKMGYVGIVAGGASLMTAEHWEGYLILAPCILASFYCSYIFRSGIGYDRALLQDSPVISLRSLVEEIGYIESLIRKFDSEPKENIAEENIAEEILPNPEVLASIFEFLSTYDLFEPFCVRLLADESLSTAVLGSMDTRMVVATSDLLEVDQGFFPALAEIARETILESGRQRFVYRQRWLLECLGAFLCSEAKEGKVVEKVGKTGA